MMVKSALMTSAYDVLDGPNTNPARDLPPGCGPRPAELAADPGLVSTAASNDWLAFLCGTTKQRRRIDVHALGLGYSLDPSDLNVASIAIGDLRRQPDGHPQGDERREVARDLHAVGNRYDRHHRRRQPVVADPRSGQTGVFTVKFTRRPPPLNAYAGGQLTWTDGRVARRAHPARRPPGGTRGTTRGLGESVWDLVLRHVRVQRDAELRGTRARRADATQTTIVQDPDQTFNPNDTTGTFSKSFAVPAGLSLFRAGVDEAFITPPGTDLDVYVFRNSAFVAQSADGDSNEMVTIANPPAGTTRCSCTGTRRTGLART